MKQSRSRPPIRSRPSPCDGTCSPSRSHPRQTRASGTSVRDASWYGTVSFRLGTLPTIKLP